jgi:hypothetical protein
MDSETQVMSQANSTRFGYVRGSLFKNIGLVILGKDESIKLVLTAWFAGGHILVRR